MSGVKRTDTHAITQVAGPASGGTIYGPTIYSIVNSRTGEEVERVDGFGNALAAQAKWNAYVAKIAPQ